MLLKNWSSPCAIAPITELTLAGEWQGAGCISPWQVHGICLGETAGTCPLSGACTRWLWGCFSWFGFEGVASSSHCFGLRMLPWPLERPLEDKAKLHLFVLPALLKTKRCQAHSTQLGVFQQTLCLTETGPITLAHSPEEGAAGRCASPKSKRTPGWASLPVMPVSSSRPPSVQLGVPPPILVVGSSSTISA